MLSDYFRRYFRNSGAVYSFRFLRFSLRPLYSSVFSFSSASRVDTCFETILEIERNREPIPESIELKDDIIPFFLSVLNLRNPNWHAFFKVRPMSLVNIVED